MKTYAQFVADYVAANPENEGDYTLQDLSAAYEEYEAEWEWDMAAERGE